MNEIARQKTDGWLDPVIKGRITCHEITWTRSGRFHTLKTGGDLFFHQIPVAGTMPHCHDFAEIVLINSGSLTHKVNSDTQKLEAGNLVFLRPDDIHSFEPDPEKHKTELVLLDFDLELFLNISEYFENDFFLQQLTAPVLPPVFKLNAADTAALYSGMLRLNTPSVPPYLRKIKLKILLGELYARYFMDEANLASGSQIPEWLRTLCEQMRKEENFKAGIKRMRKLAYHTPEHLCKCFQKYFGRTPTEFINELKINHAARLLADSSLSIPEIAEELHFKSLSRFYLLFRKCYHIPPSAYRNMHTSVRKM